jgi:hypothetical protein
VESHNLGAGVGQARGAKAVKSERLPQVLLETNHPLARPCRPSSYVFLNKALLDAKGLESALRVGLEPLCDLRL